MGLGNKTDQVPRKGIELPARGAEVAVTASQAAGDQGSADISSVVLVYAREQELLIETLGVEEAVIVDFGDELPRRLRSGSLTARDQVFQEFHRLDGIGNLGGFLQLLQHDQVAVGVVLVLDERLP